MVAQVNSVLLALSMSVAIRGIQDNCEFTWDLQDNFPENYELNELTINTHPKCSLKGAAQTYVVTFHNTSLITSLGGNAMSEDNLKVSALRYVYINQGQGNTLAAVGNAFSSTSWATLIGMLGMSLFQSVAIQSLWNFINMLQIISYIPVMDCFIPSNLELFLTEYLDIKNLALPLDLIPSFKYNPLNYVEAFVTDPFSEKFSLAGYQTISFIFNFSNEITTWLLLLLLYFVLKLACAVIPESRYCLLLS
eukprot:TRINITY_DN6483_c0_g1_i10.p1 TRINITY_DN6483_c0_g1~~TRINITY_DN6483_c0_g1_i10.p1  ORF type:complete len:250 (-),score=84.38 TRINITY_DN6483_c0_g1_i10:889-1638(-)